MSEYVGLLKEPLIPISVIYDTPEANEEYEKLIDKKLSLLFEHFKIPIKEKDAYVKLALALAKEHVPGFQPSAKKPGRPAQNKEENVTFLMAVDLLMVRDGLSIRKSIYKLLDQGCISGKYNKWRKVHQQAKNGEKLAGGYAALMKMLDNARIDVGDLRYISALEEGLGEKIVKKLGN